MSQSQQMHQTDMTTIQLSQQNREALKSFKRGGESYNDVVGRIVRTVDPEVGLND